MAAQLYQVGILTPTGVTERVVDDAGRSALVAWWHIRRPGGTSCKVESTPDWGYNVWSHAIIMNRPADLIKER